MGEDVRPKLVDAWLREQDLFGNAREYPWKRIGGQEGGSMAGEDESLDDGMDLGDSLELPQHEMDVLLFGEHAAAANAAA